MGSIVTLCAQKGGSGKSFFARHLSVEWTLRGLRVMIIDTDPQGTCLHWAGIAAARSVLAPPVVGCSDDDLQPLALELAEKADIVIIDTQGELGLRLSRALLVSDLAIIPVNPTRPEDVWGLSGTLEIVRDVQAADARPDLPAFIAVSGARRTKVSKASQKALAAQKFPVLKTVLKEAAEYNTASVLGLGITSYAPKCEGAAQFRELTSELEAALPNLKRCPHGNRQPCPSCELIADTKKKKKESGHVA